MRATHAGPARRGQRFANEQILRGPVLGRPKGHPRLVCRDRTDQMISYVTSPIIWEKGRLLEDSVSNVINSQNMPMFIDDWLDCLTMNSEGCTAHIKRCLRCLGLWFDWCRFYLFNCLLEPFIRISSMKKLLVHLITFQLKINLCLYKSSWFEETDFKGDLSSEEWKGSFWHGGCYWGSTIEDVICGFSIQSHE